ncbi:YybH family protein [Gottfriedia luciferensis]|uniref:YybH family protein n=1 Tax=Gottfriedia luciferensis TaxID=178774 RepID=UPI000B4370AC|nr:nuclear transport factor 2 family protein [Gottfriedia luciferensis]
MDYQNALQQYIAATNTHDFNEVKRFIHENAIYWFSDQSCNSIQEIQHYFENAWDVIKEEIYSATNIIWLTTGQSSASCTYQFQYEGYLNGKFVRGHGRATNVFVKNEQGHWKVIHEHLSSPSEDTI